MKNSFILVLFLLLFSFTRSASFAHAENLQGLENDPVWLRLGRYKKTTSGYISENIGEAFFISPIGRTDPKAELRATLEVFAKPEVRKLQAPLPQVTAKCQMPARYFFLMSKLGKNPSESDFNDCKEYVEFRNRVRAKSVTLVFSSYYLGNPSSVFGHTLLRLNKANPGPEHTALLDYGVNYAANPEHSNAITYAFKGLMGGFRGEFASMQYYYKVREYNDFDSRDLWEYDLNLTSDEVAQLVREIWEMGFASFRYFYLTKNCSYHLLEAIEAAAPRLNMVDHLPFWMIPADTVRAVTETDGLVSAIRFRPSLRAQFNARRAKLDSVQTALLNETITKLSPERVNDPRVLDAALDYIDAKFGQELNEKKPEALKIKQNFLVVRSRLDVVDPLVIQPPTDDAPHLGHQTLRWSIGRGDSSVPGAKSAFNEIDLRFALHSLVDPTPGYPTTAAVEFMNVASRVYDKVDNGHADLKIEEVRLIFVENLTPFDRYFHHLSAKFRLGAEEIRDAYRCAHCFSGIVEGALGETYAPSFMPTLSAYILADVQGNAGDFEHASVSAQVGPLVGLRKIWSPRFLSQLEGVREVVFYNENSYVSELKFETQYAIKPDFSVYASGLWSDKSLYGGHVVQAGIRLFQ